MPRLTSTCLFLATLLLVQAAPGSTMHHSAWPSRPTPARDHSHTPILSYLIDWYKSSFGLAANFLVNWLPQHMHISELRDHDNGEYVLQYSPLDHGKPPACVNPVIRKEWRDLSQSQRESWIDAVNCLARLPGSGNLAPSVMPQDPFEANPPLNRSASWYDDLSYVHIDMNSVIHQTGLFYPWHRYYLWSFGKILEHKCGYTGSLPYWDWTKDANDFGNSTIFNPSTSVSGIGGFGRPEDDHAVRDGAFAGLQLAYPSPHILRRQYKPYPFLNQSRQFFPEQDKAAASAMTREEVNNITSGFRGDFKAFQTHSERLQGPHMSIHLIMGGDLGGSCPTNAASVCKHDAKWSPNDPMFWMHHGMLDKMWFDWQNRHTENFWAFEGGTVRDLDTWPQYPVGRPPAMTPQHLLAADGILLGNFTVHDMFNTTSNAPLCYIYA